jgi:hypothetical protein
MRILAKFKVTNNMSEVIIIDSKETQYIDKLIELTAKSSELANIKNNIKNFRETLEQMEVIKKVKEDVNKKDD